MSYDDILAAYHVNVIVLRKQPYQRITGIRDRNGGEHREPKTGTGAGEKEEFK
jgi:hypothetical protein